jgi:hypothetical protein
MVLTPVDMEFLDREHQRNAGAKGEQVAEWNISRNRDLTSFFRIFSIFRDLHGPVLRLICQAGTFSGGNRVNGVQLRSSWRESTGFNKRGTSCLIEKSWS